MDKVLVSREVCNVVLKVFAESALPGKVNYPVITELQAALGLNDKEAELVNLDEVAKKAQLED